VRSFHPGRVVLIDRDHRGAPADPELAGHRGKPRPRPRRPGGRSPRGLISSTTPAARSPPLIQEWVRSTGQRSPAWMGAACRPGRCRCHSRISRVAPGLGGIVAVVRVQARLVGQRSDHVADSGQGGRVWSLAQAATRCSRTPSPSPAIERWRPVYPSQPGCGRTLRHHRAIS
jgi:hypothetical protein